MWVFLRFGFFSNKTDKWSGSVGKENMEELVRVEKREPIIRIYYM